MSITDYACHDLVVTCCFEFTFGKISIYQSHEGLFEIEDRNIALDMKCN